MLHFCCLPAPMVSTQHAAAPAFSQLIPNDMIVGLELGTQHDYADEPARKWKIFKKQGNES